MLFSSVSVLLMGKPIITKKNTKRKTYKKLESINEKGEDGYKQIVEE
jgi:hypothetical protein